MNATELKAARQALRDERLWVKPDPAFAVVLRFPTASPADLATLITDCDEILAAEIGPVTVPEQPAVEQAKERAQRLLVETEHFDEIGLHKLAATARTIAADLIATTRAFEAERSARLSIQASRERLLETLAGRAGDALKAAVGDR